jgi:hypothetical protein
MKWKSFDIAPRDGQEIIARHIHGASNPEGEYIIIKFYQEHPIRGDDWMNSMGMMYSTRAFSAWTEIPEYDYKEEQ